MGYCTSCGHPLDVGRYCTNCGHPVGAPVDGTGTAERPAVPAAAAPHAPPPPPAQAGQVPPPPPRYPLFADEVGLPPAPPGPPPSAPPGVTQAPQRRRLWWPWLLLAAVLVLVLVVVAVVLLGDGGDDDPAGTPRDASPATSGAPATGDLARRSTVEVPATAPPNQDTSGRRTTYVGANMLDGVPETCWRMPGDGTGDEVTVTLPRAAHLRSVGLINGYAKTATEGGRELDWYHGNRRILAVEWVFDDGTTVPQQLDDTTGVQSVDVDVTTRTVVLRLVEVSPPGKGPASRDYTAISDLSLVAR